MMPKQRFLVEVEGPPIDEDGELEELGWYLDRGADEHDGISITIVSTMAEQTLETDPAAADEWHENNCGVDGCAADDDAREKYPCPVYKENPDRDTAEELGISLSSHG